MELDIVKAIKKADTRYKIVFVATFVMGLLSQGMGLFNKYSVHDDTMNYGVGATYTSGRWMLDILEKLERIIYGDGHYSLPTFNGFLAIFFISISACIIIKLLDIRNELSCAFIACLMVCFPVITSIFGYMFTSHLYMIALLLGVLGAYLICETDNWYVRIIGILFAGASVGIYQAFIPVTITLILFYLIKRVLGDEKILNLIKEIFFAGICCGLFMRVYFVVNKFYLKMNNAELSNYKGIDSMGKSSLSEYWTRAIDAYREFFNPTVDANYFMYPGRLLFLYRIAIILSAIMCIIAAIRLFKKNKIRACVFALLVAIVPLSINFVFVMVGRAEVHSLMVYSQLLPFVFCVWIVENTEIDKKIARKTVSAISTIMAVMVLVMYSRVDNKCYLKATYAQQEAISYFTTLVTEIKGTDGYTDETQIAFINGGNIADSSLQAGDYGAMSNIQYAPYSMDVTGYVNNYTWISFMRQWTGFNPSIIDAEPYLELDEVSKMPSYPDKGSIKLVDDVLIVKF